MTFIRALGGQWQKSEFAHQLALFIVKDNSVHHYFSGATNHITVANLIAAISYQEQDPRFAKTVEINPSLLVSVLFDCFHLLFIKAVQLESLSQAEHIIMQLAKHYAVQVNNDPQAEQILHLSTQLEQVYATRRSQQRNMGRH